MPAAVDALESARLLGERMRPDHRPDLRLMYRDPDVMATLAAQGELLSEPEIDERLERHLAHWEEHGFGYWMFREQGTGRFVGWAGLRHLEVGGGPEIELGYAVRSDRWRRGFATEMGAACLDAGFGELGLDDLVCFTLHTNTGSQRVMQKLGFRYERDVTHAELPHVLYRLRSSWRQVTGDE